MARTQAQAKVGTTTPAARVGVYFSDVFSVEPRVLERYGAFNVSLVSDLPLFVDPFLIFNSRKKAYRKLHRGIVRYLRFLYGKARTRQLTDGLISAWYRFPEIAENWLGFSQTGNDGRGLGKKFAHELHDNLGVLLTGFHSRRITKDVHLEKLCLVSDRVGRDNVSDFTTNLIHEFLLKYTSAFAKAHIAKAQRRMVPVQKARFNYQTETWQAGTFDLPVYDSEHVLLTPRDLLTKDEPWINRSDFYDDFESIPDAIENKQLREQVNNYFLSVLPKPRRRRKIKKADRTEAILKTLHKFPALIDYYIKDKESKGDRARRLSDDRLTSSEQLYVKQVQELRRVLETTTNFYNAEERSFEAAYQRALFLKDAIENKGCHRVFYVKGKPIQREEDLQIIYRFTWFGTSFDVSREVNDGRGPADFKVSKGAADKALVEMKLGSNTSLARNLKNQSGVYERASDAKESIKVILNLTRKDENRVRTILRRLRLEGERSIVVIDGRADNKPSGSKA